MTTTPDFVEHYRANGWATIRAHAASKQPIGAWQGRTDEAEDFGPGENVGVRLGAPSGGLVDVDLDCDEAVALAPLYLPTTATFGRASKPKSHWVYLCPELDRSKKPPNTGVELRSTGLQTIVPPSIHTSGEAIEWTDASPVAAVAGTELLPAFGRLVTATVLARCAPKLQEGRGIHHAVLAVAGAMWREGATAEQARAVILPALELHAGPDNGHRFEAIDATWDEGNDRNRSGWPTVKELFGDVATTALKRSVELWTEPARVEEDEGRPQVDLNGDLGEAVDQVVEILARRPSERARLFRGQGALCTIDGPCDHNRLAVELARLIAFVRGNQKGGSVPALPPREFVARLASVLALDERIPELRGTWSGPLLHADGSVRTEAGYDSDTKLWCEGFAGGPETGTTHEEAVAAAQRILGFVHAGQWQGPEDVGAFLAHVLTVAARPMIEGSVPAFVYSASATGAGKTTLARMAGLLGGGCSDYTEPSVNDDAELARRLDEHAHRPAVVLDNLRGVFRTALLEGAVTGGTLPVRRLYIGPVVVLWRAVLAITSNGAEIGRDWVRRSLPVRLAPAKLDTKRDLLEEAEGDLQLRADAVTIVRAWLLSGEEPACASLASFAEWSRVVAGAVAWVGGGDIVTTSRAAAEELAATDEDDSGILDVIADWLKKTGRTDFSSRELYDAAQLPAARLGPLGEALGEFASVRKLARRLARTHDSRRAITYKTVRGTRRWMIVDR
ncbi:MAG: bifunctional DNA primase/polymerase [Nannocystales bacterium]